MQIKNILCPVDFSPTSDAALSFASALARQCGARLLIAYVEESPVPFGTGLHGTLPSPLDKDHHRLAETCPEGDVEFERILLIGHPVQALSDLISERDLDLVVIGSHGRTGLSRVLLGSVAEGLVRKSSVPVLTVKNPSSSLDVDDLKKTVANSKLEGDDHE